MTIQTQDADATLPLATFEDYAAATFEADPRPLKGLGTQREWLDRARGHFPIIQLALCALNNDADGTARKVAAEPDSFMELVESIRQLEEHYRALCEFLVTAQFRIVARTARYAKSVGELPTD